MCWNDGYERKRFEKKLKKQREEYEKQGMTDAQIEEIEKKDWEIYRSDRCYYSHTQPLEFEDDNFDKEDCTPLCKFFSEELCDYIHPDYSNPHSRLYVQKHTAPICRKRRYETLFLLSI